MKMLFKKRRYYQGAFRDPGTVMEVVPLCRVNEWSSHATVEKKETDQNLLSSKLAAPSLL